MRAGFVAPWPCQRQIGISPSVAAELTKRLHRLIPGRGSYGGYQAFQWAVTHPEAMNAIVAVNTAPKGSGDQAQTEALVRRLAEDPNWNGGRYYENGGIERILTADRTTSTTTR